ncbi:MAG: MarR family transcriptional regulator [Verrucomicrobiota bacterium]
MKGKSAPNDHPRYQALLQLLRSAESVWNASRVFFEQWNISSSQFNILNLLYLKPKGSTQIELSRELITHRSNVTGLVDRLEKRGLLQRKDSSTDRRAYKVVLTKAGEKLVAQILPDYYAAAEKVWSDLPLSRTAQLIRDLEKLNVNLENLSMKSKSKP